MGKGKTFRTQHTGLPDMPAAHKKRGSGDRKRKSRTSSRN
jgi:hypothetical protein